MRQDIFVKRIKLVKSQQVPLHVSFNYNPPESDNIQAIHPVFAVERPSVSRFRTGDDVMNESMVSERLVREIRMIKTSHIYFLRMNTNSVADKEDVASRDEESMFKSCWKVISFRVSLFSRWFYKIHHSISSDWLFIAFIWASTRAAVWSIHVHEWVHGELLVVQ